VATNPVKLSKRFNPFGANGKDENLREMSPKFFLELLLAGDERRSVCGVYLNSLSMPVIGERTIGNGAGPQKAYLAREGTEVE